MDRERFLSLWAELVGGGGLTPGDESALLEALERDPALRAELLDDEALDGLLRSSSDALRDGEEFAQEVTVRLAAERDSSRFVQAVRDKVHAESAVRGARAASTEEARRTPRRRRIAGLLKGARSRGTSWIRYGLLSAAAAAALAAVVLMGPGETRRAERDGRQASHGPAPRRPEPARVRQEPDRSTERPTTIVEERAPETVPPHPAVALEPTVRSPSAEEAETPTPPEARPAGEGPEVRSAPKPEQKPVERHVAYVDSLEGTVESAHADADGWAPASAGSPLFAGHRVRTLFSRVRIAFETGSTLYVNRFTTLALGAGRTPQGLELVGGEVYVETVGADRGFWVQTPHGRAVDLGTRFGVEAKPTRTTVVVVNGSVEASAGGGSVKVPEGHEVLVARGSGAPGQVHRAEHLDMRLAWTQRIGGVATAARAPMPIDLGRTETHGKGKWRVHPRAAVSVKSPAGMGLDANSYFLFGTSAWRDYVVRSRVRLEKAHGSSFGVGVVGYWQESARSFRARFMCYEHGGQWRLTRGCAAAGNDRSLARAEGEFRVGDETWIALELRTQDGGVLLRAKTWPVGALEPAAWGLEARVADQGPTTGLAGFWAFQCEAVFSETSVEALPRLGAEGEVQR